MFYQPEARIVDFNCFLFFLFRFPVVDTVGTEDVNETAPGPCAIRSRWSKG